MFLPVKLKCFADINDSGLGSSPENNTSWFKWAIEEMTVMPEPNQCSGAGRDSMVVGDIDKDGWIYWTFYTTIEVPDMFVYYQEEALHSFSFQRRCIQLQARSQYARRGSEVG